jgi:hypothetical protein
MSGLESRLPNSETQVIFQILLLGTRLGAVVFSQKRTTLQLRPIRTSTEVSSRARR